MTDHALEQLVDSLLWEGYALYPYTPGATKNATPTPFGIVYPPAYAPSCAGAFDHLGCGACRACRPTPTLRGDGAVPGPERRAPPGRRAPGRAAGRGGALAASAASTRVRRRAAARCVASRRGDGSALDAAAACATRSSAPVAGSTAPARSPAR